MIGRHLQAEQNLTADDIAWLTTIAQAILRALMWDAGQPMRTLAARLEISPQTLYTTLRLVIQASMWVRRNKTSVERLAEHFQALHGAQYRRSSGVWVGGAGLGWLMCRASSPRRV